MSVGFDVSVLVVGYLMVIGVVMDIYLVVAVVNCMFVLEKKNSYLILSYLIQKITWILVISSHVSIFHVFHASW